MKTLHAYARRIYGNLLRTYWHARSMLKARRAHRGKTILEFGPSHLIKRPDNWLTIGREVHADLILNLENAIPLPANSMKKVYTSHTLEHLSDADGIRLLREAHRILKCQGEISIVVPDMRKFIEEYHKGVNHAPPPEGYNTWMDWVADGFYCKGAHLNGFDEDKLIASLRIAGFSDCKLRDYDPEVDMECHRSDSIHAVGYKLTE